MSVLIYLLSHLLLVYSWGSLWGSSPSEWLVPIYSQYTPGVALGVGSYVMRLVFVPFHLCLVFPYFIVVLSFSALCVRPPDKAR
jgi:hypothetical protein